MMIRHKGGEKKGMKQPKKEKSLNSKFAIATISSANCYQEAPSLSLSLSLYPRVAQTSEQARTLKQASKHAGSPWQACIQSNAATRAAVATSHVPSTYLPTYLPSTSTTSVFFKGFCDIAKAAIIKK
jgi:hypothetical protein